MTDIYKIKTENTGRASTTTLADDPDLIFTDLDPGVYALTGYVLATCASSSINLKAGLRLPSGNYGAARLLCSRTSGTTIGTTDYLNNTIAETPNSQNFSIAANATIGLSVRGTVHITSPSTLSFQWSQNASSGTSVAVLRGSWLKLSKLDIPVPGKIQLSSSAYTVDEDAGNAVITVNRVNGFHGAASVRVTTSDGTATAGEDYTAVDTVVEWADEEMGSKEVIISITDDSSDETNLETFTVTLSEVTGATLGSITEATVSIDDEDPDLDAVMIVAVSSLGGTAAGVMRSNDGSSWESYENPASLIWNKVVWAPELGKFVAVSSSGSGNRVMTSLDGADWEMQSSAADNMWTGLAWSPELNLFVAVASSSVMTSPDGITWTLAAGIPSGQWKSVAWSPSLGMFAAVAVSGTSGQRVMTSTNGTSWNIRSTPTTTADLTWNDIEWSPELGMFAAVASSGTGSRVMTSTTGTSWTVRTTPADNSWQSIAWSPSLGMFAAVATSGTGNRVMTSTNGSAWTTQSTNNNGWRGICWSPALGLFIAVAASTGTGNRVMTSPDGTTWTTRSSAGDLTWLSIATSA